MEPSRSSCPYGVDANSLGVEMRDLSLGPSTEPEEPRDDGKEARLAVQETARNPTLPITPDGVISSRTPGGAACMEMGNCHPLGNYSQGCLGGGDRGTTRPEQEVGNDDRASRHAVIQEKIKDAVFGDELCEKKSYQTQESPIEDVTVDPDTYPRQFQMEHYDVVIIYLKPDVEGAVKWKELLETRINVGEGKKVKVALIEQDESGDHLSDEFPDIGSKFQVAEEGMKRSTYTHLFMSKEFVENNFQKLQVENCIMESINNPDKKWSVIPVYTLRKRDANFKVPFAIMSLKGLDLSTFLEGRHLRDVVVRDLKIEEKDRFFLSSLTKALKGRLCKREKREKQQQEALEKWISKEKERKFQEALEKKAIEELAQRQKEKARENLAEGLAEDKKRGIEEIEQMLPPQIDTRGYWKSPENNRNPALHHSQSYPNQSDHQSHQPMARTHSADMAFNPNNAFDGYPPQQMNPIMLPFYNQFHGQIHHQYFQPNQAPGFASQYPYYHMPGPCQPPMLYPQNAPPMHWPPQVPLQVHNYPPPSNGGQVPNQAPPPQAASQPEVGVKRNSGGSETQENIPSGQILIKSSKVFIQTNPPSDSSSGTDYEIDFADPSTMGSRDTGESRDPEESRVPERIRDPSGSASQQPKQLQTPAPTYQKSLDQTDSPLPDESMRARPAENTMSDRVSMRSQGDSGEGSKTKGLPEGKLSKLHLPDQAVGPKPQPSPVFEDCSPEPGFVESTVSPLTSRNAAHWTDMSESQQENLENTYVKQPSGGDSLDELYMQATVDATSHLCSGLDTESLQNHLLMGDILASREEDDCQKSEFDSSEYVKIDSKEFDLKKIKDNSASLPSSDNHCQQRAPTYTSTDDNQRESREDREYRIPSIPVENPIGVLSYRSSEWSENGVEIGEEAIEDLS